MNKDQFAYLNAEIKVLESERDALLKQVACLQRKEAMAEKLAEALNCAKTALKVANSLEREAPIDIFLDCIIDDISMALRNYDAMGKP